MIKTILKFAFAVGLLYWPIHSGKIDFSLITKSYQQGPEWLIAMLLIITQGSIVAFRYKLLIQTKSEKNFTFLNIVRLNWIGMFFSSILPGAVTGDLIKLFYIKKFDSSLPRTFLITSVLIDRVLGLLGLLFVSGLFSSIYYDKITKLSPQIIHVVRINFLLFLGGMGVLFLLVAPKFVQKIIAHFVFKIPKIGHKLTEKMEHIFSLSHHRRIVFLCLILSVLSQFLCIFAFWFLTKPFFEINLPLQYAVSFIPIGLIAIAIPISPAGIGVGHAIFQNLFQFVGIHNGASLFNLFFICTFLVNIIGVIPYLLARPSSEELKKELEESC